MSKDLGMPGNQPKKPSPRGIIEDTLDARKDSRKGLSRLNAS